MKTKFYTCMHVLYKARVSQRFLSILLAVSLLLSSFGYRPITAYADDYGTYCGVSEHHHGSDCYSQELVCGRTEGSHWHTEGCYTDISILICQNEDEEHVHDDSCYGVEHVLTCVQEEYEHYHDVNCYVSVITCGMSEHTHSLECYSDRSADLETRDDWERVVDIELSGIWADDVIAIAETQLGYSESSQNYIVNNGNVQGYTRYGEWYGSPYALWDAIFVSFCIKYAGVYASYMPLNNDCERWVNDFKTYDMFGEYGLYEPNQGDVVFFYDSQDVYKTPVHCGIVVSLKDDMLLTIEGFDGIVNYHRYDLSYEPQDNVSTLLVLGYGILPENPDYFDETDDDVSVEEPGVIEISDEGLDDESEIIEESVMTEPKPTDEPIDEPIMDEPVDESGDTDESVESDDKPTDEFEDVDGLTGDLIDETNIDSTDDSSLDDGLDEDGSSDVDENAAEDESDEKEPFSGKFLEDGVIYIHSFEQLLLVGTDEFVHEFDSDTETLGEGDILWLDEETEARYSLDAVYCIVENIEFPEGATWCLPDDFYGKFSFEPVVPDEDGLLPALWDEEEDIIYIYNPYQLMAMSSESREEQPLMSGDAEAETFGTGKFFYLDKDGSFLTYSEKHRYVLTTYFNEYMPEIISVRGPLRAVRGGTDNSDMIDGRDYFGQVSVEIDGTTYILIGTRQQLDALNSNERVRAKAYGPVFKVYQRRQRLGNWNDANIIEQTVTMIYPGDADLLADVYDGSELIDFSEEPLYSGNNGILSSDRYHSLTDILNITGYDRTVYCTVDSDTGTWSIDARSDSTLSYDKNGDYIVFRNIDMSIGALNGETWRPLMFTGTMYGVKSESSSDVSTLWNAEKTSMNLDVNNKPEISNFIVEPETLTQLGSLRMDIDAQVGVGFFGTISGDRSSSSIAVDPAIVNNIRLYDGTVNNYTTKAEINVSVVNGVLVGLAALLGTVLDPALKLLIGKDVGVQALLEGLLNARARDPGSLATGAFAGRIVGDAHVLNSEVDSVSVNTVATEYEASSKIVGKGGFVGLTEGETKYDTLSLLVGGVGDTLSGLLNLIPGVGLGDLVVVLLDNALPLKDLIPTGYAVPTINSCSVINGSLSTESGKYGVGGFVGTACGTDITDCSVVSSDMTICADYFGGGFAGIARDAIIKGTLSGVGIDIGSLHPQAEMIRCLILNSNIRVSGGTYQGGFVGAMANSYGINDTISGGSLTVDATGDYVGGFCGYAHLGTVFGFGSYLEESESLLSTVKGLATGLLGSGSDQSLLDVGGVAPSAILGLQIDCPLVVETDGAFVGGIVGRGNGTFITESSPEFLSKLGKYDGNSHPAYPISMAESRPNMVSNLVRVRGGHGVTDNTHADKSFTGGLAGYLTTANVGGLLGDTLGVAEYLNFTVSQTTIQGVSDGYTVTAAADYGAGGIGWSVGGDMRDIELINLRSVSAENHAGGFVGATGPGDLVNGNGLDVKLLGISLIKIDNLLSLASGIRTTYRRANVTGISEGFAVVESGSQEDGTQNQYVSGGWAGLANSVRVVDCQVNNLAFVTANMRDGSAGGFVGMSSAGGLAGLVEDNADLSVAQVGQLVDAVPYLVPSYDGCSVHYVSGGYVAADTAGGFAGDFQSGKVNKYAVDDVNPIDDYSYSNEWLGGYRYGISSEPWSVYNIDYVLGGHYAGGWGGRVYSGALVSAGGGLSVLGDAAHATLSVSQLLGVASVYVPSITHAGVYSPDDGYVVFAAYDYGHKNEPASAGMAGGFIGYGSGVQVSYSDVYKLRHGIVNEPTSFTQSDLDAYATFDVKPSALESQNGGSYMSFVSDCGSIPYAVAGARYAGGYIGYMDIGSAASVGDGLKLLDNGISLTNVLDVLSVVVSTIEHSDVYGKPGGFNVVASSHVNLGDGSFDAAGVGYAGGFAGKISGGHVQDSNVSLFGYIIGEVAAGGYVGEAVPGDVANVLDNGSLSLLGDVNSLASLVQDFVPTIRNSETTCIPCGGAVRAEKATTDSVLRGMAGGYIGHGKGVQIWGNSSDRWLDENPYMGDKRECAAIRIRSVYGYEYSGGYVGLLECGNTAETGGISLLGGLLTANNVLSALQAVYPTIYNGAVYGPLERLDEETWNAWVQYVGSHGGFYPELIRVSYADAQNFIYGMHVVAGRHTFDNSVNIINSGCAGGFVGAMHGGVIRYSFTHAVKQVAAMRAAGGFAGDMQTQGAAELGNVSLLGLNLNLGNILSLADVLVPCVSDTQTYGYQKGMTVQSYGAKTNSNGYAGGFVGNANGGQFGREHNDVAEPVVVYGLKVVYGTKAVGGFIGNSGAAAIATADTNQASNGLLQGFLNSVISTPSSLLQVMQATMTTIKFAEVHPSDETWGIVIDGRDTHGNVADYAGGFAGYLEASVLGERHNADDCLIISGLRRVIGGYYAGGFFGLADTTSVANVGSGSGTSVLDLIYLGNTSLLDAFRTYIYHASVEGVSDGILVEALLEDHSGTMRQYQSSGGAGGFGGGLMNGTVENSAVTNLNRVTALNYSGGFIGKAGKSGVLDLDQLQVGNDTLLGKLLGYLGIDPDVGAQLLSIVGSTIKHNRVSGFGSGALIETTGLQSSSINGQNDEFLTGTCAGGFIGFADTAQMEDDHVYMLKRVSSTQNAGGFIGRSAMAYVAEVDVDLTLVNALLTVLEPLIKVLYGLTTIDLIDLGTAGSNLGLQLLADGNLVYLNLFGLEVGVSLMENDPEYEGSSDSLTIVLGSSSIKLPYNREDGYNSSAPNASINLIEGNRTSVKNCDVTGVMQGYDVFGGGASQASDGQDSFGYAGGFVGYNKMGYFSHDRMWLCDVVRGTSGKVGPFVGGMLPGSRGEAYLEGNDNWFSIYRADNPLLTEASTYGILGVDSKFGDMTTDTSTSTTYNRYDVLYYDVIKTHADLRGAKQRGNGVSVDLLAYDSAAKAVLMLDAAQSGNPESEAIQPDELKDPCYEFFDLTAHKKWRDYNNKFNTRPDVLEVEVYMIDVGIIPRTQLVQAIYPESDWNLVDFDDLNSQYPGFIERLGSENPMVMQLQSNADSEIHWTGSLEHLPVAYMVRTYVEDEDGNLVPDAEVHYLQYVVVERVPQGYTIPQYEIMEDTASVVIINELSSIVMPNTGASYWDYFMLALIPLCAGIILLYIDVRRRKVVISNK